MECNTIGLEQLLSFASSDSPFSKQITCDVDGWILEGPKREVTMRNRASRKRSAVKAITYRAIIVCLDFLVIYLLTGKVMTAAAFMIVSNIYTTVGYFLHERLWAGIKWGIEPQKEN
ncbi:MAG: DUF2061 domain-containing protein [Candidatus Acidiferrales bacterium]